jgi:putative hydrolase of HD superfamily
MSSSQAGAIAELCAHLATLKRLPRTGWLQRGVAAPESVAEHIFGVALLALAVAPSLAMIEPIERERLLTLALLHDLGESLLTDLPSSARLLLGSAAKQQAEQQALSQTLGDLAGSAELLALWEEYRTGSSREARLVKALDRIEMLAQALAYERAGQRDLDEFWVDAARGWDEFPLLGELAAELAGRRPRSSDEQHE